MSTLYDVLEVSEKASKEVIEKAYRVLAKRYHPDLQTPENRASAEAKMKQINEAYDILSDDTKRKEYDESLLQEKQEKQQEQMQKASQASSFQAQPYQNQYYASGNSQQEQRYRNIQRRKYEEQLKKQQEQMQRNMQEQYENAYYNYLRSLGYKIKERWTWKKTKKLLLIILVLIAIIVILWLLPPTHNMMMQIYENNTGIKIVVDIVVGFVMAIVQTFVDLFKDLLQIN